MTLFSYHPGDSLLYRLDPRLKLVAMAGLSIAVVSSGNAGASLFMCFCLFFVLRLGIGVFELVQDLKILLLLLTFVFFARAFSEAGEPLIQIGYISLTHNGVNQGWLAIVRILDVVFIGLIFIATTKTSQAKNAVAYLFRFVPFVPEKRVGTMLSLMTRFIPLVFETVNETRDAMNARGGDSRNSLSRIVKLVVPVMRRSFEKADKLAIAMESRCYNENGIFASSFVAEQPLKTDILIFFLALLMCLSLLHL